MAYRRVVCQPLLLFAKNFWQPWAMTTTDHLARLGRMVRERREHLGLRQDQMGPRGGPSTTTLTKIENATGGKPPPSTLRKLDLALNWLPGSAAEVLRGGEPSFEPTQEQMQKWRAGYEGLDYEPLIPPAGDSLDTELDFIVTNLRSALGMLQKRKLWLAIQLINQASSDLSDYLDERSNPNAEPTAPSTNPPAETTGAPGTPHEEAGGKVTPLIPPDQGRGLADRPIAADHGPKGPNLPPSEDEFSQDPDDKGGPQ